jgi:hypothetical protein
VPTIDLADIRPALAFGRESIPEQPAAVLVRNATVWTQGPQGIIENGDLLVQAGRVTQVGRNLQAPAGAVVIDGTGKHVTPGLIDAHLHAGASGGINEGGGAIVPEVQLGGHNLCRWSASHSYFMYSKACTLSAMVVWSTFELVLTSLIVLIICTGASCLSAAR